MVNDAIITSPRQNVRHLPVVSPDGHCMGMLSMRDLAYELSQPAEILANTLDDFQVAVCSFCVRQRNGNVCVWVGVYVTPLRV